jgi:hypothetical protein
MVAYKRRGESIMIAVIAKMMSIILFKISK